jgi:hypothetical protein
MSFCTEEISEQATAAKHLRLVACYVHLLIVRLLNEHFILYFCQMSEPPGTAEVSRIKLNALLNVEMA